MSATYRTRVGLRRTFVCGTLLAAAALTPPVPPAAAAPGDPQPPPLSELLTRLRTLYLETEKATEVYNRAEERLEKQRARTDRLTIQLIDQRIALGESRDLAGLLARRQYQDGAVSPYLYLLLSEDPQDAFAQRHMIDRAAVDQADVVKRLEIGERRMTALNRASQDALDESLKLADKHRRAKERVEKRLREVEKVLAGLSDSRLAALQRLEQREIDRAQRAFLASGRLGSLDRAPSWAGSRAVEYAYEQLGKPYVWGAEGPWAYDCSGLTSQAWWDAGWAIPRTSQEQWRKLPRVPLSMLRPGDLVVYFKGATHVAIYTGGGMVIQAPRPGGVVKVSPIASNPIIGAVRPDHGEESMSRWRSPVAPASASAPTPFGDGADSAVWAGTR